MELGDVIKAHRQVRNLTRENVAEALKTTADTVGAWERNEHVPQPRHVRALAHLFGVDAEEFARPVRPTLARALISERRRELLAESPDLLVVERDPFGWRLNQTLRSRDLDVWAFARRLGITDRTAGRWLAGDVVPPWEELWRLADLLDVPVWWWRCGGADEQDMYGPYELPGAHADLPPSDDYGWRFAEQIARRFGAPVEDIVRTAYPGWAGWRWRGRLGDWAARPAPPCPVQARLQIAVLDYCAETGGDVQDAKQWVVDVCDVTATGVTRWLDGQRAPRWGEAYRAALALGKPAWWLWLPRHELAAVRTA